MLKRFGLVVGMMVVSGFAGMFTSGCGDDKEEASAQKVTAECKEIFSCVNACTTDACKHACLENATPEGRAAYMAMDLCETGKCSQFSGEPFGGLACVIKNCGEAWTGCMGDWGTASCTDIRACFAGCAEGDSECGIDCLNSGSEKAQIAFTRLLACMEEQCQGACASSGECDIECAEKECAPYLTACSKDQ